APGSSVRLRFSARPRAARYDFSGLSWDPCGSRVGRGNDPAAEADFAAVEHRTLARRDRPLRLLEGQLETVAVERLEGAARVGLTVARLGTQRTVVRRRLAGDPAGAVGLEPAAHQPRVVVALHHHQRVAGQVL